MAAIISGKLVKLGASQNAAGGTELLAERLIKGSKKELFKNETNEKFSISNIWNKLIDTKDLHGYESKQNFYHLTNLEIFKKLKDL